MLELVREGQQVEHAVGRSAGCRHRCDRVVDRGPRHDLGRSRPVVHELHHQLAGTGRRRFLGGIGGGDPVQAAWADAEELERGAHRVGRELAAARTRPRARGVLDLAQLLEADLPGPIRADRLEHRHHRRVALPSHHAGVDGAVVEDQPRQVEPRQRHGRAGQGLVAADQADEPVEQVAARNELDRVGDHLAADQGRLHSLGAHAHAVGDGDGVELHRRAARRPDALLDLHRQVALVVVAGHRLDPGRADADDRLGEVLIGEADGLEHGPRGGSVRPVQQDAAVLARVVGAGGIGHEWGV